MIAGGVMLPLGLVADVDAELEGGGGDDDAVGALLEGLLGVAAGADGEGAVGDVGMLSTPRTMPARGHGGGR